MLSLNSFARRRLPGLVLTGTLLLGFGHSWGQATARPDGSVADPFATYHSSLSKAADRALSSPAQPVVLSHASEHTTAVEEIKATPVAESGPAVAFNRVQQLRPVIEPILREERVPTGLAAIVLVESGGQPNALSPKGARGIWQFMPETARRYGLVVSPALDERLDIPKSTRAAARYLRDLYAQFGDWKLAVAAYNAGEDAIQRAIDRNGTRDFVRLSSRSIPFETRKYVPAVFGVMTYFGNIERAKPLTVPTQWKVFADAQLND